ncbi:MAG TPA: hypothetical protein VI139_07445 [Gemmatimonadales bacterium]
MPSTVSRVIRKSGIVASYERRLAREGLRELHPEDGLISHAGLPHDDASRPGRADLATRLAEGAEMQARREAILERHRFPSAAERRLYRDFVAGKLSRRQMRSSWKAYAVIHRAERAHLAEHTHRLRLQGLDASVWRMWCNGQAVSQIRHNLAHNYAKPVHMELEAVEAVVDRIVREVRALPTESADQMAERADRDFVAKLGDLTPEAVLKAARKSPDLAHMLVRLGYAEGAT